MNFRLIFFHLVAFDLSISVHVPKEFLRSIVRYLLRQTQVSISSTKKFQRRFLNTVTREKQGHVLVGSKVKLCKIIIVCYSAFHIHAAYQITWQYIKKMRATMIFSIKHLWQPCLKSNIIIYQIILWASFRITITGIIHAKFQFKRRCQKCTP